MNTTDLTSIDKSIRGNTKFVFIESPTNPLMALTDIAAVARLTHPRGAELVVDNTFMSPYFQRPISSGADLVIHSTPQFLNGHSDGVGGVIVATKPEHAATVAF